MEIQTWFKNIPVLTRHWFGFSVLIPLLGRFGIIPGQYCILNRYFISKFQIWRPVTALFFYPITPSIGFHYLITLYFLYNYSLRLETGHFNGRTADYLTLLTFNWLATCLISYFMGIGILLDQMVMSVLYIWCQMNKDTVVQFWFGTQFKAFFLPWVLFGFNFILGNGGATDIIGIIVGHMYYFLAYKYPQDFGGQEFIQTPSIFYQYFPTSPRRSGIWDQRFARPVNRDPPAAERRLGGGHSWGSGRTLGNN